MILVFGSINVDLVARVEAIPRPGETVLSPRAETFFGGKGANQAVAAAAAGARVVMAGAIGADAFGAECRANFGRRGVGTFALQEVEDATGMAFIAVGQAGENAITVASGANLRLNAAAVPDQAFEGVALCVLQMEVPAEQSLAAARRARAAGAQVLLNLAPAPADLSAEKLSTLLEASDILVVNAHEAEVVTGLAPRGATRPEEVARIFGLDFILTLGGEGLLHFAPDETRLHYPATPVEVVDTTGAGDTFVGALSAALAKGAAMTEALPVAGAAASRACAWAGAQPPLGG